MVGLKLVVRKTTVTYYPFGEGFTSVFHFQYPGTLTVREIFQ